MFRGKAAGFGPGDALEAWCVCSWDEREAAGSWAVGLFLFHLWAASQTMDTGEEREEKGIIGSSILKTEGRIRVEQQKWPRLQC